MPQLIMRFNRDGVTLENGARITYFDLKQDYRCATCGGVVECGYNGALHYPRCKCGCCARVVANAEARAQQVQAVQVLDSLPIYLQRAYHAAHQAGQKPALTSEEAQEVLYGDQRLN